MKNTFLRTFITFSFMALWNVPLKAEELHAQRPLLPNIKRIVEDNVYPPFVRECFLAAIDKLKAKADAKGAVLKKETIKVEEIDNRWYNLSKYVWFSALIETPEGAEKVTVLMQKPFKGACF